MLRSFILSVFISSSMVDSVRYAPQVQLQSGKVRGKLVTLASGEVVRQYLGIPYAKAKRFEKPVPPDNWNGINDATSNGKVCWQYLRQASQPLDGIYGYDDMSEDCLNLNIFVPDTSRTNLPVMVFVHGGSSRVGANRGYDGGHLATIGEVIVVVINYRLGLFGFAAFGSGIEGNYGMYDQIESLKWVKSNIASFGGNPSQVTLFGHSAGGFSVSLLCLSPLANGLFDNAIMQSGVVNTPWATSTYHDIQRKAKDIIANVTNNCSAEFKTCFKRRTPRELVQLDESNGLKGMIVPVIDGTLLPEHPLDLLKKGKFQERDIMVGVTDDDGSPYTNVIPELSIAVDFKKSGNRSYWIDTVRQFKEYFVVAKHPAAFEAAIYRYTSWANISDPHQSRRMLLDFATDYFMTAPSIQYANYFAKLVVPRCTKTYFYQLQYAVKQGVTQYFKVPPVIKTYHEADRFILFGYALNDSSKLYTKDANFSRTMIRMWTNFAKTGNPNSPGSAVWPEYDTNQQQYLALKPNMEAKSKLRADHMAFWNVFLPDLKELVKCPGGNGTQSNDQEDDGKYLTSPDNKQSFKGFINIQMLCQQCCSQK